MNRTALASLLSLAASTALSGCLQKTTQTVTKSAPAAPAGDDIASVGA